MSLDPSIRNALVLPAICAPMFLVSGPDLVREACKAGLIGGLPRQNARSFELFEGWLKDIREALDRHGAETGARVGPIAVNLATRLPEDEIDAHFRVCQRYGVEILITVGGDPTALVRRAHDAGLKVFHDVTSLRFAEKAMAAKADGLTCIGAGGGGHSGTISHLALIRTIRAMYDGTIIMAGAVSDGATIRAAEVLGADLAYLGTRFIATVESEAPAAYKDLLVSQTSSDLVYTGKVAGVPANWLLESIRRVGLDPDNLPEPLGRGMRHDHLPAQAQPWKTIWSAGQGIDLINDIPTVADLVRRLRREYVAACQVPDMAEVARLVDEAGAA
ncbi:NAD(P)H-dependent flavin oxidoreductase [Chelatococcus reniformis]|uniref:2-nitropropane dioxygenase n=1 Tax=Chelatococcus reniformis TaxID=1494448 RepID=A0A916U6Z1_9HYPH|nr:nitronate monooxygenase [Chelatococcus reniformis]GGC61492.1 2-nitropropane dioxygenase [Chelatococcus reniformis]